MGYSQSKPLINLYLELFNYLISKLQFVVQSILIVENFAVCTE